MSGPNGRRKNNSLCVKDPLHDKIIEGSRLLKKTKQNHDKQTPLSYIHDVITFYT